MFVFLVNYWWFPVNSTRLVGNFPYPCQRLEKDDFIKYINFCKDQDLSQAIKILYDIFDRGYSVIDILDNLYSEIIIYWHIHT